jgi:uncharacterized protein
VRVINYGSMGLTQDLYDLYLIDQQVRGLSRGLNAAASHVRGQQAKLDQLNQQLSELGQQLRHAQAAAANLENDAATVQQRIDRLREQMNSAKTNKEYSAFLVEINTLKVEKGKIEEQALEHLTRVDKLKEQAQAVQSQAAEVQRIKSHAEKTLSEREAEVGDQLAQVRARRETAARQVPPKALTVFEKLNEATDGEALAEVTREDPRSDYTCGGCYMALPMERVNLLATTDEIVRCPSCGRILYLATETRAALSEK